ncbi:hypothetical protein BRADI_4g32814v3, partial [Brachypodium distachyon]
MDAQMVDLEYSGSEDSLSSSWRASQTPPPPSSSWAEARRVLALEAESPAVVPAPTVESAAAVRPVKERLGPAVGEWTEAKRRKTRRKAVVARPELVLPCARPRQPLPKEMAGLCYNCLGDDHIKAFCPNPSRCFLCGSDRHHSRECAKPLSERLPPPPPRLAGTLVAGG